MLADRRYRLSHFIRGCNGTELYTNAHAAIENFTLSNKALICCASNISDIGKAYICKAISVGTVKSQKTQAVRYTAEGLRPLSVPHMQIIRHKNRIKIQYIRRARSNADLRDYADVLLDEKI